ncbi:uncharacterized protein CELE_C36E8.6 [Caenorhabditis elegans]|uniref:Uncharacterized protein n=1 Tax=Caenorhabditis elegans TaxID=6239 RepID=Q565D3_CAEEL|nr:Uncharacterized protein CELE_C36E8.6 [Caenorhabditis elegans]CAI79133.1 Uncharacterized protein CELE_C36E8.6 [Caenorhabditis elegans]|eukprot:NP_001021207.1 Uncharacterized protein CELE_C36E8.6 [Caenorhabditis elegans]
MGCRRACSDITLGLGVEEHVDPDGADRIGKLQRTLVEHETVAHYVDGQWMRRGWTSSSNVEQDGKGSREALGLGWSWKPRRIFFHEAWDFQ